VVWPQWWQLTNFDGGWFRAIALDGYGPRPAPWPPVEGQWTRFPFFPLFPLLGRAVHALGIPVEAALVLVAWAAALVAVAGIHRLASRHVPEGTARLATWISGLLPGALTLGMAYSDGLFLAGSVWAVVLAEDRRWGWAGVAALVATAARPNGGLVLVTVALVVVAGRGGWRAVAATWAPSVAFLAGWAALMVRWTGDPVAFLTAKDGWFEVTLPDLLDRFERNAFVHLVLGGLGLLAVLAVARRLPVAWTVHTVLCTVPSLALGLTGLARYAAVAFPVPIALALLAHRVPMRARAVASGTLVVGSVLAAAVFALLVTRANYVP
jgi:Gpi18-like mannosyltransferase